MSEVMVERWTVKVELAEAGWSEDYAELTVQHSDGMAEITREEARQIAAMLLKWADQIRTEDLD